MQNTIPIAKGAAAALVTVGVSLIIPLDLVYPFYALLLTFAAGVYVGFSIVDEDNLREAPLQIIVSLAFIGAAFFGLWTYPLLIPAAWVLHGLWDLLHHLRHFKTETGGSYPLLCLTYDWIVAAYLAYFWMSASS